MPRPPRIYPAGVIQHIYNRGNRKQQIFLEPADYLGFLGALADAAARTTVRLIGFCLLTNHWHLLLWPAADQEISSYMQLLMNSHIRDLQARRSVIGNGHFYGGRHKNRAVLTEKQLWIAGRYVEGNALKHGLVNRAEDWPWSSLNPAKQCTDIISAPPMPRPANWIELVNQLPSKKALKDWARDARKAQKMHQFASLGVASV
jgi:putative transposase